MRTLGGVALPEQTIWTNQTQVTAIAHTTVWTVDGTQVHYQQMLQNGKKINLLFHEQYCWLSWEQVQFYLSIAVQLNHNLLFEWDAFSAVVMFDHSNHNAVMLQQLLQKNEPEKALYIGQLNLIALDKG